MSDTLRITGMASGLDVDSMVKTMMKAENMRMDKLKQDRQLVQWKQDIYRELTGNINIFKSSFFDVLKSDSYILSPSVYSAFDIVPGNPTVATASANAAAAPGTYNIKNITLAETANIKGEFIKTKEAANTVSWDKTITAGVNDSININVGGISYGSITLDSKSFDNMSDFASAINSKLVDAKDANGVSASTKVQALVSDDGTKIEFSPVIAIGPTNKEVVVSLTDALNSSSQVNYKVTLDEGNYTLKSLTSALNSKLTQAVNQSSGVTENIVGRVMFDLSDDGTSVAAQSLVSNFTAASNNNYNVAMAITGNDTTLSQNKISTSGVTIDSTNNVINASINGTSYRITIANNTYTKLDDLKTAINNALQSAVKTGDTIGTDITSSLSVQLSMDGTRIQFVNNTSTTPPAQINLTGTAMKTLGFSSIITDVYPSLNDRMSSLINSSNSNNGYVEFIINNVQFKYNFSATDSNRSINDILNDISSKTGLKASYSELGQVFTLASSTTGSDQQISGSESDSAYKFLNTLFGASSFSDQGSNATATITDPKGNSSTVNKTTNTFTIDGVTYNLLANDTSINGVSITLTSNSQKTFDKIKAFIDKYNETIDGIREKILEKKQYDYKPLTDEQKKDMKEDDIKSWEDKAKQGLLGGDSMLQNMLNSMRRTFFDSVNGAGISLKDIGISTDSDYTKGGKIIIDEAKLKSAIQNNGDKVSRIFSQTSKIYYDPDHKTDSGRYNEVGIFQRINDILKDYTRTTRDSSGRKGLLIEKAGIVGDLSEFENMITKNLNDNYDKRIKDLTSQLAEKENNYYQQFSKLETAMQQLNQQSSWLTQQLGAIGGQQ